MSLFSSALVYNNSLDFVFIILEIDLIFLVLLLEFIRIFFFIRLFSDKSKIFGIGFIQIRAIIIRVTCFIIILLFFNFFFLFLPFNSIVKNIDFFFKWDSVIQLCQDERFHIENNSLEVDDKNIRQFVDNLSFSIVSFFIALVAAVVRNYLRWNRVFKTLFKCTFIFYGQTYTEKIFFLSSDVRTTRTL